MMTVKRKILRGFLYLLVIGPGAIWWAYDRLFNRPPHVKKRTLKKT